MEKAFTPWLLSLVSQRLLQGMLTPLHFWITHELVPPVFCGMSHSIGVREALGQEERDARHGQLTHAQDWLKPSHNSSLEHG